MKLQEEQMRFAEQIGKLIEFIIDNDYLVTFGEAYRTKEQAEIYAKEGKGIVNSLHCERLAIDLNLYKDGVYLTKTEDYEWLGNAWENMDPQNRWGGCFKRVDGNHFERRKL